ncbi:MAG: alpha/beta hydrolase [Alkalispirochaeta sp.]
MEPRSLILIHGYGVRSYFWNALRPHLAAYFDPIETPDLELPDIESGVAMVTNACRTLRRRSSQPVVLVGHSLGGILAALAARDLEPETVSHLVVIASPYGHRVGRAFGPILRLRFTLGVIGKDKVRRRFFGPAVPEDVQRSIFDSPADESAELKALGRRKRWFHTGEFPHGVPQRALAIGSAADRIVHIDETREFAEELNARMVTFPSSDRIGHDDFGVWDPSAEQTAREIVGFVKQPGNANTQPGGPAPQR